MTQLHEVYPSVILPRVTFKRRLNVDRLLRKYPELLVVRMVEGEYYDYLLDTESEEKILSDKVFKNSMANLSMNLAGGLFDTSSHGHLKFLPTSKEASLPWKGRKASKRLYSTPNCYKTFTPCFGLCFHVRDIHKRTFPFYKHFETKEERDKYAEEAKIAITEEEKKYDADYVGAFESKKKPVLVRPRIRVHHSPSRVNYWHMTLDTYRPTNENYVRPESKLNSSDSRMFKALKQDLVQCCCVDEMPAYRLEKKDYYNCLCYYLFMLSSKLLRKQV